MPIKNLLYDYKMQCIEVFLSRAFNVTDQYTHALEEAETEVELDHAFDILLGYEKIVFKAVYSELNALVELELKILAKSILDSKGEEPRKLTRGKACKIIEQDYGIRLKNLSRYDEVDEIMLYIVPKV